MTLSLRIVAALALGCFLVPVLVIETRGQEKPAEPAWKALFDGKTLTGWKSTSFVGEGKVLIKEGAIRMEKGKKLTGVTYARADFPKSDYEVEIEARKIEGGDFFATTTFPVADQFASFVVGGWGGTLVGLSSINGSDASENGMSKNITFEEGKWYKLRVKVGKVRVQCFVDQEKIIDLDTTDLRLNLRFEMFPARPFGIATYDTIGEVRAIKVRGLADKEKKELAEPIKEGN